MEIPVCKQCGYELTGLGDRGKCPECGNQFFISRREGVLIPDSPEQRGARLMQWFKIISLAVIGVIMIGVGFVLTVHFKHKYALYTGGFFGAVFLFLALTGYLGRQSE